MSSRRVKNFRGFKLSALCLLATGTTALYNLTRLSKSSDYFECLGAIDETNSMIGLAREYGNLEKQGENLDEKLEHVCPTPLSPPFLSISISHKTVFF